jgi:hypothetical protein
VLGELSAEEAREIEALSAESPALRREIDQMTEALARTAELLPRVRPAPSLRARLLETLTGVERFAPFLEDLTCLFELPVESMRRLLARVDGSAWESTLQGVRLQGTELFHFQVGPRLAADGAAGGVVLVRGGVMFPRHPTTGTRRRTCSRAATSRAAIPTAPAPCSRSPRERSTRTSPRPSAISSSPCSTGASRSSAEATALSYA